MLADGYGPVLDVKVRPEKGSELTLAQSTDQLQIEHGEQSSPVGGIQIILDMLRWKNLHFDFLNLRRDAVLGRIARNQALLDRPLESVVQHQVETTHGRAAQSWIAVTALASDASVFHQIFVELL